MSNIIKINNKWTWIIITKILSINNNYNSKMNLLNNFKIKNNIINKIIIVLTRAVKFNINNYNNKFMITNWTNGAIRIFTKINK
jgi:hypothetical protein